MAIDINGQKARISASFGVSNHCGEINIDSLLKAADKALYQAKLERKKRFCMTSTTL